MKKVLFANGDSWTFGSEIMAPEFCVPNGQAGAGMAGRYLPGKFDFGHYNDFYRIPRIWPSYLGEILDIPTVVNVAAPARSNDTIYENTIEWILENYISKGKSTDELLVVIGWSTPERKNVIIGDDKTSWMTFWPAMHDDSYYKSDIAKEYFKFYVTNLWVEQEYIKRFVEQNYQLQNFFKTHNIDYYLFNAFYLTPNKAPGEWKDLSIIDNINGWANLENIWADKNYNWASIQRSLKLQWNAVDNRRFINKDAAEGSFRSYIYNEVPEEIRMCNWHPSPESHEVWANFLADYIR